MPTAAELAAQGIPVDPYAAIRTLNVQKREATDGYWGETGSGDSSSYGFIDGTPGGYDFDFESLRPSGFQSKYNQIEQLPDGTLAVTLQQPGGHKYDTMKAIYAQGADGKWEMQDAHATRQKGSGLSAKIKDGLMDVGVSERIAEGLSNGPGSSAALMVDDIARGVRSIGVGGTVGRINDEVMRNSSKDIEDNARATSRAAMIASLTGGGSALAGAMGGGTAGGAASGALFGGASAAQGSGKDILKGAVLGGVAGGIRGYMNGPTATPGEDAVSGMDLAADAPIGSGNNITTAGEVLKGDGAFNSLSSADRAVLRGDEGYGEGMPGTETGPAGGADAQTDGYWNGKDFSGDKPLNQPSNLNSGGNAPNQAVPNGMQTRDWIQLAGMGLGAIGAKKAGDDATDAANRATDAARASADATAALGREQLDFTKTQYYDSKPQRDAAAATALEVSKAQLASQQQQDALAKEYADYNRTTFRPLEQGIVKGAQEYDTPEKRAAAAASAIADVDMGMAATQQSRARQLAANGVNPGSTKAMSIMGSMGLDQARSGAGAAYQARKGVETTGFARQMDAASLGRNLPSSQATSAALALNAGNSAVNNAVNGVNVNNSGVKSVQDGYGLAVNASNAAGGLYSQAANNAQRAADTSAQLWSNLGTAAGTAASRWSDETLKTDVEPVSDEEALAQVQATPVSTWKYDPAKMAARGIPMNAEDQGEQTGPMAQDVNATMGEQAAPGGKKVNLVTLNGRTMAATRAVNNKVDRLAQEVQSLASLIRGGQLQGAAA